MHTPVAPVFPNYFLSHVPWFLLLIPNDILRNVIAFLLLSVIKNYCTVLSILKVQFHPLFSFQSGIVSHALALQQVVSSPVLITDSHISTNSDMTKAEDSGSDLQDTRGYWVYVCVEQSVAVETLVEYDFLSTQVEYNPFHLKVKEGGASLGFSHFSQYIFLFFTAASSQFCCRTCLHSVVFP